MKIHDHLSYGDRPVDGSAAIMKSIDADLDLRGMQYGCPKKLAAEGWGMAEI